MASALFVKTFESALKNDLALDLDNDTFYCMLANKSQVTDEVTGTNYTTGGNAMTGITFAGSSDGTGTLKWDAANVTWPNSTISAVRAAVIYDNTVPDQRLIGYIDFLGDFSTTSGTFQIEWNASGIFTLDLKP
jgi:hypothetical protein